MLSEQNNKVLKRKDINVLIAVKGLLMHHFGKEVTFYSLFWEKMDSIHNISNYVNALLMLESALQCVLMIL